MILLDDVIAIHKILIDRFGGSYGVRDKDGLESAIARPYHTFDQIELYPSPIEKAAAIFQSLLINHPFVDGNKRIAYFMMRLVLLSGGMDLRADEEEKYQFVISSTTGLLTFDEIKRWLSDRCFKT